MNQPILVVPSIALDVSLLDRLARSVDFDMRDKIIINGGRQDALDDWKRRWPDWKVFHFGKNLGFGGSCNMATRLYPESDGYLLMNDDGEFMPGCLERMCKAYDEHAKKVHMIYVNENQAFDICVWTRKALQDFGTFDENLWPAYFDDTDMRFRFSLDPNFKAHVIPPPFPVKHGKPRACGPKYHAMMDDLKPFNESYMMRKWGSVGDAPLFRHPFNDPNCAINHWDLELDNRENREVICKRFWNQTKPSLYE